MDKEGIYPTHPATGISNACKIKVFSLLIVRIGAVFSGLWHFSVSGVPLPHRVCNILPGWSRGEMAGRKPRSVSYLPGTTALFPAAYPKGGQQCGTICTAGSRKYFAHRYILPHRPTQCSCPCHSYSIHVPAFLPGGTAGSS